jgi:hypothetical protein
MAFKIKVIYMKEGFDIRKFLIGAKRPIIAVTGTVIGYLGTYISGFPQWDWLGAAIIGISAERVWSTIEFYLTRE